MKTLDCESIESTYKSLENILGIKKSDLCQLFDSINVYEEMRKSESDFLLSCIQEKTNCEIHFDKTCWFHATRTWQDNEYEEGLLPSYQAIPKIDDFLSNLIKEPIRLGIPENKRNIWHYGPIGFLIREIAFVDNSAFNDYFKSPEIIVDNGYEEPYKANTVKCIVKFVNQEATRGELGVALLYVYHKHCGQPLDYPLTWAYNGKGVSVPKENICKIEKNPTRVFH